MQIKPAGSLIFIEPRDTDRAVLLIDHRQGWRGNIIAVGPKASLSVGDFVHLKPSNAIEGVFHQQRVWIVREEDLLAVETE